MIAKERVCLSCKNKLEGRSDKKFCDIHCKSSYQYQQSKLHEPRFYNKVDNQLKLNRKILKYFNKAGKSVIRVTTLIEHGFDPNFFTHYWKNSKGDVYLFVYEYGFLKKKEHNLEKYILIKWQHYMS
jgi:hypothetical protein